MDGRTHQYVIHKRPVYSSVLSVDILTTFYADDFAFVRFSIWLSICPSFCLSDSLDLYITQPKCLSISQSSLSSEFWRERNASLSALVEQLKTDTVRKYLSVLQKADSVVVQNFEIHRTELSNFHTEAKDNVRFLSTLERCIQLMYFSLCYCFF